MDLSKAFGIALRKLRISKGLTQEQLGFESELRRTFISSELGEKKPSLTTIYQLAKALYIPMSKLMKYVEKEIDMSKKWNFLGEESVKALAIIMFKPKSTAQLKFV